MSHKSTFALPDISAWLTSYHGEPIADLQPMAGGYWSSAFSYLLQQQELVLRLGESDVGYRIDQMAQRFNSETLPVPEVLDIGRALDHQFAISRRHSGGFIEVASSYSVRYARTENWVIPVTLTLNGTNRPARVLQAGTIGCEWA